MGGWVLVGLVFIAYAVVAGRLDRLSISAPIVLVAAGIVLGAGFLDVLPANPTTETVRLITELTLALILFADASTIKFRQARSDIGFPSRLPGIGLPLTILLGTPADGQHLRRLLDRHEERSVRQVDLRVVIRSRAGGPVVVAHSAIDAHPTPAITPGTTPAPSCSRSLFVSPAMLFALQPPALRAGERG